MLRAKFRTVRHIPQDLGFTMQAAEKRFPSNHARSKTWSLFPPRARYMLDSNGLFSRDDIEERLRRKPVAG